jgi:hypothetical protein
MREKLISFHVYQLNLIHLIEMFDSNTANQFSHKFRSRRNNIMDGMNADVTFCTHVSHAVGKAGDDASKCD